MQRTPKACRQQEGEGGEPPSRSALPLGKDYRRGESQYRRWDGEKEKVHRPQQERGGHQMIRRGQ